MKWNSPAAFWCTALILSSILLAFISFATISKIEESILIYIAQCLVFVASVIGLPTYAIKMISGKLSTTKPND